MSSSCSTQQQSCANFSIEDVLSYIFLQCDPHNTDAIRVSMIIDCIRPYFQNNPEKLEDFKRLLDPNNTDVVIAREDLEMILIEWVFKQSTANKETDTSDFLDKCVLDALEQKLSSRSTPSKIAPMENAYNLSNGDCSSNSSCLEERIKELEHSNRKLTDDLRLCKAQEHQLEDHLDEMKFELRKITHKYETGQEVIHQLNVDLSDLEINKEEYAKAVQSVTKLEKELKSCEKIKKMDEEAIEEIQSEKEHLREKLYTNNCKLKNLEDKSEMLRRELTEKNDILELLIADKNLQKVNDMEQKKHIEELRNIIDVMKSEKLVQAPRLSSTATMTGQVDNIFTKEMPVDQHLLLSHPRSQASRFSFGQSIQCQLDAIELGSAQGSKHRLSQHIDTLNTQVEQMCNTIKEQKEKIVEFEKSSKDYELTEKKLVEKVQQYEKICSEKDLTLGRHHSEFTEVSEYARNIKDKLDKQLRMYEESEKNLRELTRLNEIYAKENKMLQESVEYTNKSKTNLESQILRLKSSDSLIDGLRTRIAEVDLKRQQLELEVTQKSETVKNVNKKNDELRNMNAGLIRECEQLSRNVDAKMKQMTSLQESKVKELTSMLEKKKQENNTFRKEMKRLGHIVLEARDEVKESELRTNILEVHLKECDKKHATLQDEYDQVKAKFTTCQIKLRSKEEQNRTLQTKFNDQLKLTQGSTATANKAEKRIGELESKLKGLQDENQEKINVSRQLEEKVSELMVTESELLVAKDDLNKAVENLKIYIIELESRFESLAQDCNTERFTNENLRYDINNLEKQITKLQKYRLNASRMCESCLKRENLHYISPITEALNRTSSLDSLMERKESYATVVGRVVTLRGKLDMKSDQVRRNQEAVVSLENQLRTSNAAALIEDFAMINSEISADRVLIERTLMFLVDKFRKILEEVPEGRGILKAAKGDLGQMAIVSERLKNWYGLRKAIRALISSMRVISRTKFVPPCNLDSPRVERIFGSYLINQKKFNNKDGAQSPAASIFRMDYKSTTAESETTAFPSLTDSFLKSLGLTLDSKVVLKSNPLEDDRFMHLMLGLALDNDSITTRKEMQQENRDRQDASLLTKLMGLFNLLNASSLKVEEKAAAKNQLIDINRLCCHCINSAERLGAIRYEMKMLRSFQLVTTYVAKMKRGALDKLANLTKSPPVLTSVRTKRRANSSTEVNFKDPSKESIFFSARGYTLYLATVLAAFLLIAIMTKSEPTGRNVIPWRFLTWEEVLNQIFHVHYAPNAPM